MKYILDTNTVSYWMRGEIGVLSRLKLVSPKDLAMASITLAEILYGIEKSPHRKAKRTQKILAIRAVVRVIPFGESAAGHYGRIRCHLEGLGTPIGERDIQIAAIAQTHHLIVVTHNVQEFRRVQGLEVEDWR